MTPFPVRRRERWPSGGDDGEADLAIGNAAFSGDGGHEGGVGGGGGVLRNRQISGQFWLRN